MFLGLIEQVIGNSVGVERGESATYAGMSPTKSDC